jgi:hypothetical protein
MSSGLSAPGECIRDAAFFPIYNRPLIFDHTLADGAFFTRSRSRHFSILFIQSPINFTLPETPQAVFDGIGYFHAGHIHTVAVRLRIIKDWAHPIPIIKTMEGLMC